MNRHNITLSEPVSEMVKAQVKSGRYKDFWPPSRMRPGTSFMGCPTPSKNMGSRPRKWNGPRSAIWPPFAETVRLED